MADGMLDLPGDVGLMGVGEVWPVAGDRAGCAIFEGCQAVMIRERSLII